MIITVDTGNKMIKTETLEFHAGVEILDQIPGEQEEVILYGGSITGQPAGGSLTWKTKRRMTGILS